MLRQAVINLLRNWITTIPTIITIAIVLTIFHELLLIHANASDTLKTLQQKVSLTIYLKADADPFEVGNLITALEQRPEVKKPVVYTSPESARKELRSLFGLDTSLLQKYRVELPASITITTVDTKDLTFIRAFTEKTAGNLLQQPLATQQQQKQLTDSVVSFINKVKTTTQQNLFLFILLFIGGSSLMLASTIHLALTHRHREISIMKLVGAPHSKMTAPFVVEGVLISITAFLIHLGIISLLPFEGSRTLHLNALLFEFMAIAGLGAIVSYAVTRYSLTH